MVKRIQRITVGTPQSLLWQCELLPATVQHAPELCWANLTLEIQGQILWQITGWPLVDLLNGLARIWPWLMYEEGYPIDINPDHIGQMMGTAEQRWMDLPVNQAEAEENALFDYRQRHDLSLLLRGINVPTLCLLREGLTCQIWSPAMGQVGYANHDEVIQGLEQLCTALAQHIKTSPTARCHPRATQALVRWQQKQTHTQAQFLQIVTGLTQPEIEALRNSAEQNQKVMTELLQIPVCPANAPFYAQANELQMAARMTMEILGTEAQMALLQFIQALPQVNVPKLDQLSQQTPPFDEMDAPYEQGYQLAYWLRMHFKQNETMPLNPEDILIELGITPQNICVAGPIDAAAVWGPNHGPAILVNEHNRSRASRRNGRRTTLAHEICHLLVDRKSALPAVEVLGGQVARRAEQRANAFAAELLLPRAVAAAACSQQPDALSAAKRLQRRFTVSREMVVHQIQNSAVGMTLSPQEHRALDQWRNEGKRP